MNHQYLDFHERFNQWVDEQDPTDEFKFWVMTWLTRIQDDPRSDASRAPIVGEPWWFAKIPNAEDDRSAVVCLYSIKGSEVRCSHFATLGKPIV